MQSLREWLNRMFANVELGLEHFHDYQHVALKFLQDNPFSALFLDTGLGKTPILLKLIDWLVQQHTPGKILVIAPLRVATVTWPDEIPKWQFSAGYRHALIRDEAITEPANLAGQAARNAKIQELIGENIDWEVDKTLAVAISQGKSRAEAKKLATAARTRLVKQMMVDYKKDIDLVVDSARLAASRVAVRQHMRDNPATIYLINKEMVEFVVAAWGRDWPFETVIVDESSSLKDHKTKRWKALWRVRPRIKRLHQLTATPSAETHLHLFAQINLLDMGKRFGRNFGNFAKKYFDYNSYSRTYKLREGAEDQIAEKISDICLVMKQEDYLSLQQPQKVTHPVKLSAEQMALYRTMEKEFVIQVPDGSEVEAETAAALSQKLMQMSSGVVYETVLDEIAPDEFKPRRVVHHLHDHKIDALRQLQEEVNGENLLVAYYHQSSLDRLLKAFPEAKVMDEEGKLIKDWNKGKIPMLLLHPQSGAHGLNLQKGGRHVVFFDLLWSYENYYQFYRRLARQGQELLVIVHHLVAQGTIDEHVMECLQGKHDSQDYLFKLLQRIRARIKRAAAKRAEAAEEL